MKITHEGYIYTFWKNLSNNIRSCKFELKGRNECKVKIKVYVVVGNVDNTKGDTYSQTALKVENTKANFHYLLYVISVLVLLP